MDYNEIELLVIKAKDGDEASKELLAQNFRPFIINLSKKTFIHGYEFADIQNECYRILFYCLKKYSTEKHRFVAYATNGIKNSINDLIEKHQRRSLAEGNESLIFTEKLENCLQSDQLIDENLCLRIEYKILRDVLNELEPVQKELVTFVFLKNKTILEFSKIKNITYNAAITLKNIALSKMSSRLNYLL